MEFKKDGMTVSKAFPKKIKQAKTQNHQNQKLHHTDKSLNINIEKCFPKYSIHIMYVEKSSIIEMFNRP
ncbi:general transcription factor II-I repeat domain-containing protein 2-like [Aphis craccivora]|uniref:General transcription factor II-I repeat domain-containing protein 2-like n=1 Tax=Aphis craccivora TaxID=307492 RepID=A0A6G0W2L5_APHCR|nr:general transcription factor II-I repeat domain-containing protein 2-like [Aphis craccivora]